MSRMYPCSDMYSLILCAWTVVNQYRELRISVHHPLRGAQSTNEEWKAEIGQCVHYSIISFDESFHRFYDFRGMFFFGCRVGCRLNSKGFVNLSVCGLVDKRCLNLFVFFATLVNFISTDVREAFLPVASQSPSPAEHSKIGQSFSRWLSVLISIMNRTRSGKVKTWPCDLFFGHMRNMKATVYN